MGIKIHTDRTLAARDKEKDDKITELEQTIADKNKRISELATLHERDIAQYIETIKTLKDYAKNVEQELTDKDKRITALVAELREPARDPELESMWHECKEQRDALTNSLHMAHAVETNQAEVIATQKREIATLSATNEELEQAYGEYGLLFDATVTFLKRIVKGTNIRTDKPGGRALVEDVKALLKQYGHGGDTQ